MIRVPILRSARFRALAAFAALPLTLSGCNMVVFNAAGDVARQQGDLVIISTLLMLLIIIPVMALTIFFAWKYRQSNQASAADYDPDWDHSTQLELVIWAAPLLIIIALGAVTWISTHLLDPYRPLERIAAGKPIAANDKPLEIQVVSLDWKWLFIYPEQGVATVNELALPVDRQVRFRLTSSSVMNAFYVPELAGMIYTMPGMETKLHAVLNKPGTFGGISSNYSGAGFSGMHFKVYGVDAAGFDRWAAAQRGAGATLDVAEYTKLEKPTESVPVIRYATVAPGLFDRIVQMCVQPGQTCMSAMMHHDMAREPGSHPPVNNVPALPGEPEGGMMQSPREHDVSPHRNAPHHPEAAPGKTDPGSPANRNMTRNQVPARPGATPVAAS
ncbi:ubiquinol oxidase subunit II [Sphingomonas sp. MMS12-HWE2-04]|uniref:ubiquinol oxidase subunit II n=1 Tax=Sphingomonas sp. MMS12-HWE2-04 TaxID=3234199 RepID=UPI00384F37A8